MKRHSPQAMKTFGRGGGFRTPEPKAGVCQNEKCLKPFIGPPNKKFCSAKCRDAK